MPQDPAPQTSGGNTKYVLIGLLLLGGAVGLYVASSSPPPPPPAPPPPAEVERVNPLAEQALILEDDTPDAGPPVVEEPEEEAPKKRATGPRRGDWECSGDLPSAGSVINTNRAQVRSCYERRLKVNNVLQGDLTLRLKVGANGKVAATQVSGSLGDKQVFDCVKRLASSWSFPVPEGGACAVVQVPFRFSPKNP